MDKRKKLIWLNMAFWIGLAWITVSAIAWMCIQNNKEQNTGIAAVTQTDTGIFFLATGSEFYILDNQENILMRSSLKDMGIFGKVTDIAAISEDKVIIGDAKAGTLKLCAPWTVRCDYFLNKNNQVKNLYQKDFVFTVDSATKQLYVEEVSTHKVDTYTLSGNFIQSTKKTWPLLSMENFSSIFSNIFNNEHPEINNTVAVSQDNENRDDVYGDTRLLNTPVQWPIRIQKSADNRLWVKGDARKIVSYLRQKKTNTQSDNKLSEALGIKPLNHYFTVFEKGKFSLLSVSYSGEILGSFGGVDLLERMSQLEEKHASLHTFSRFIISEMLLSVLILLILSYLRTKYRNQVVRTWTQHIVGNDYSSMEQIKITSNKEVENEPQLTNPDILWIKPMPQHYEHAQRIFFFLKFCIIGCIALALYSGYSQVGLSNVNLLILMTGLLLLTNLAHFYFVTQQNITGEIGTDGKHLWLRDYQGRTVMAHPSEVTFTDRAITANGITVIISQSGDYGSSNQIFPMGKLMCHIYPLLPARNKVSPFKMGLSMLISKHPKVWSPVVATLSGLTILGLISFSGDALALI